MHLYPALLLVPKVSQGNTTVKTQLNIYAIFCSRTTYIKFILFLAHKFIYSCCNFDEIKINNVRYWIKNKDAACNCLYGNNKHIVTFRPCYKSIESDLCNDLQEFKYANEIREVYT